MAKRNGKHPQDPARKQRSSKRTGSAGKVPKATERPTADPTDGEKPVVRGRPFVKGDPRINRTKPGPGARTKAFKRRCAKLLENPKTWRRVRTILIGKRAESGVTHAMFKTLSAYAHGSPTQKVDMKVTKLEDLLKASHEVDDDEESDA